MARRSSRSRSSRPFSWLTLLAFLAFFIYRAWQKSQQPQPPTPAPTRTKAPSLPPTPSLVDSNEGNLLLGNPSNAAQAPTNFLVARPQLTLSYNRDQGGPNWVAWHTDAGDLGGTDRGKFRPDPLLPKDWQITPSDYTNSGNDRGHVCPSGDRTASRAENDATFFMSNMLPQTAELNRHIWADFENYLRSVVREGNEIYQVAGGAGVAQTIDGGKIAVPKVCWKVALILPVGSSDLSRINAQTRVICLAIPNVEDKRLETGDWRNYTTTAAGLEKATGLDFFVALPKNTARALENKTDKG